MFFHHHVENKLSEQLELYDLGVHLTLTFDLTLL